MAKKKTNKKQAADLPKWLASALAVVLVIGGIGVTGAKSMGKDTAWAEQFLAGLDQFLYGETAVVPAGPVEGTLQVDIIDVGQGESILITTADTAVLIDAGENNKGNVVLDHLAARGVERLDIAIGTHPHSDHIGGLDTVLESIPADVVLMGYVPEKRLPTTKTYLDLLDVMNRKNIPLEIPELGQQYQVGDGVLTILGPVGEYDDLNNCSLICRLDFGEVSFLFSGDAEEISEQAVLKSGANVDVDVMTMGHHGSSTSSSKAYFQAASPEYAAISCGKDNDYGHPHRETITKLKNADVTYYRTDLSGTITYITDGTEIIKVETER